jgi:dihydroflavonol-4-reductase
LIIVSGATGFLGSHLVCHLLEKGHAVKALKRSSSTLTEFNYIFSTHFEDQPIQVREDLLKRLTWAEADLFDIISLEEALAGASEVYHCAAIVSFLPGDRDRLMRVNVQGTANMVNAALQNKVARFCHVSSIASLGRDDSGTVITESNKWRDSVHNSNYAISKYKGEMEVWRGIEEGLHAVIVNPSVILGVGDWKKGSCRIFDICRKGMPFYTGGVNGYVDVRDVARAMYMLMNREASFGQRYILSAADIQMKLLMTKVAEGLGTRPPRLPVNRFMAEIAWRFFALTAAISGKEPAITRETARTSIRKKIYS